MRALAFLGRHATRFMALGVLLGLAAPPLAALCAPLLVPTLLIPLTLALLRLDWAAILAYRRRPALIALLLAWLLLASPVLVWLVTAPLAAAGLPAALRQALVLMGASSPIVSSVALALILGLDATLAVVGVIAATALVPLTLPAMAALLLGVTLEVGLGAFMLRLAVLVGAAFGAAWLIRQLAGRDRLVRAAHLLDGLTVISLVIFAVAIMDGVTAFALQRPGFVAMALLAAFAFNLLLQWVGYRLFRRLGERSALAGRLHVRQLQHGPGAGGAAGTGPVRRDGLFCARPDPDVHAARAAAPALCRAAGRGLPVTPCKIDCFCHRPCR